MPTESSQKITPALLLLQDGTIFKGESFGYLGSVTGEICFNTGMVGYQEVFTDPSYYGQIIIANNVHTGNYGCVNIDEQSKGVMINGLIGRNLQTNFSRHTHQPESLNDYLIKNKIVAINGIDTRALVKHICDKGAMNVIISSTEHDIKKLTQQLNQSPNMDGLELASNVSTKNAYEYGDANAKYKVAVYDFGVKKNILDCLVKEGLFLKVFPAATPFEEIEKTFAPDAYFLSNGPGDPAAMPYAIDNTKKIINSKKPLFGICLGNQLLALANDVEVKKMHHGHRGLNHPIKNIETGLCEITSQNHGFNIDEKSLAKNKNLTITHINLNDNSVEGIKMLNAPAFSVQYHPEAAPGPHDSYYLFKQFYALIAKA